jgi:hypothetical protein
MKRIVFTIILTIIALFLYVYLQEPKLLLSILHHIKNPSPLVWNNVRVEYDFSLFSKVSDNGLKIYGISPNSPAFLGISLSKVSDIDTLIGNVAKTEELKIKEKNESTIGNYKSFTAIYENGTMQNRYTIIPDKHLLIIYSGPHDVYHVFKLSFDSIQFLE